MRKRTVPTYPTASSASDLCATLTPTAARLAYGIQDAATALALSRSRIYELIAAGEIAACKVGKRTIIPASELTAFLERHRVARLSGNSEPPRGDQKPCR